MAAMNDEMSSLETDFAYTLVYLLADLFYEWKFVVISTCWDPFANMYIFNFHHILKELT